jgi:hypothetical protein
MEMLFTLANVSVLPFWLLMIFLPSWRVTERVMRSVLVVAFLPLLYAFLVLPHLRELLPLLFDPTLERIAALLGKPEAALIGWVHFLAFDLFVGRWVYLDSRSQAIPSFLMAPVLFLTLLLGPLGLVSYLSIRFGCGRRAADG